MMHSTWGMVSFGHGMFYGLGAYAFALTMQMTDLSLPVVAVLAVLVTTFAAFCVGAICVRLSTDYFAFITLAVQMLFYSVIISWQSLTGGDQGLRGGIPRREIFGFELASQLHMYQFCAIELAVLGLLALRHISASPFGQTLRMIRDNENRASFLGIVLWRARLWAFTIAGAFAGLGGVLAALFVLGAHPELADWPNSGQAIFAVMLGGVNSFLGPVVGAMILLALNDHARARLGLAYVPEDRQVFPEHSVEDNLLIAAKDGPDGRRDWTLPRVWETFPLLERLRSREAGRLSGGEQQLRSSPVP